MHTNKPETVKKAVIILWVSLGVGVVGSIVEFFRITKQTEVLENVTSIVFAQFFLIAFIAGLIWAISKRKNWARWIFIVFFILGTPFSIMPLIDSLNHSPLHGILGLAQVICQAIAVIFLLLASSRKWFVV